MLVTNIVVETLPGKARSVADLISHLQGVQLRSVEGDSRVLAIWNVPADQNPEPEGLSEALRAMTEEILQVAVVGEEVDS